MADYCIREDSSIRDAAECINRNLRGIALVVDVQGRLLDTITDGDIRRAVLDGVALDVPVMELRVRKAKSPGAVPVTAPADVARADALKLMQRCHVRQLPLVDGEGRVVNLVTLDELLPGEVVPIQAVVMAGGFGTRLHPLTDDTPKPMLPVGDRPLLERIIDQLRDTGIHRVNLTTHFQPEKIRSYFGDGRAFGVSINYVNEESPLGTAGALGLMTRPAEPLLVINGDILTKTDFRFMRAYHEEHGADLTVGVRQYDLQVPYGVIECDGPHVCGVREKPMYNFFVSAGIYLLEPSVFDHIPGGRRFDMPDLIEALLAAGRTVISFPIVEYWLDIGQHVDYVRAQDDLKTGQYR